METCLTIGRTPKRRGIGRIALVPIFTFGYFERPIEESVAMLVDAGIDVVVDVRSVPFSRRFASYNRLDLRKTLRAARIRYLFLGEELGARRREQECYVAGRADYARIASLPLFRVGIARVTAGAASFRLALMCAERDPLECHRSILIGRCLFDMGADVRHLSAPGEYESHPNAEIRLVTEEGTLTNESQLPMFGETASCSNPVVAAYKRRGEAIAYRLPTEANGYRHDRIYREIG